MGGPGCLPTWATRPAVTAIVPTGPASVFSKPRANPGTASMKCRHCDTRWEHAYEYCPQCERNYGGAKYPATQTDEELREIGLLLQQVRTAFAGVVLGGGETIHQAHLEGTCSRGAPRWIAEGEKDPETDWSEVPDWKLEQGFSTLCFFDVEGWRFYLPAFLCWSLRNWRTTDFLTADALVWNLTFEKWGIPLNCARRFESLNREQSEAVYAFLDLLDRYSGEADAGEAIRSYWHRFRKD